MRNGVSSNRRQRGNRRKRGVVIYYMTFSMVALCAILFARGGLRPRAGCKDRAASRGRRVRRAAASALPDYTTGQAAPAVAFAGKNNAEERAVVLDAGRCGTLIGTWKNGTFTVLTGNARSTANAVRVTARCGPPHARHCHAAAVGKVIGAASCGCQCQARDRVVEQSPVMNIVGIDGLTMIGNDPRRQLQLRAGQLRRADARQQRERGQQWQHLRGRFQRSRRQRLLRQRPGAQRFD